MKDKNSLIALFFFIITFTLLFLTIDDMGPTWDELYLNPVAAKSFAEWIKNSVNGFLTGDAGCFFRKENIDKYFGDGLHYHPPFGRILHALSYLMFNGILEEFEAMRVSPMIMFSILVGLLYLSVAKFYGKKSGIFAVISLVTMPRVFGHAHLFALDTPIMFMWFLTVYCFIKGLENRIWSLFTAIAWGLAMDTKAQGYLIIFPLIATSIIIWWMTPTSNPPSPPFNKGGLGGIKGGTGGIRRGIIRNFLSLIFISPVIVYLANPWLWHNPFENFFTFSTAMTSHAKDIGVTTYYLGKVYHPSKVPWHYPFIMTFVTVPPVIFILFIIGGAFTIKRVMGQKEQGQGSGEISNSQFLIPKLEIENLPLTPDRLGLLFLLNALAAISMIALPFAPKYDGVRLILSAFPFIAGLSGIGFYYLTNLMAKKLKGKEVKSGIGNFTFSPFHLFTLFLMLLLLSPSIKDILMLRPYYLAYYNIFTGSVRGARDSGFETTYWGDPLNKKFIEYLNNHFDGKSFINRTGYHRVPFDFYHDKGLLSKSIKHDWEDYDYYMLNMRQSYFDDESWFYYKHHKPVYSVTVQGVDLVNIYHAIEKRPPPDSRDIFFVDGSSVELNKNANPPLLKGGKGGLWKGLILIKEDGKYEMAAALNGKAVVSIDNKEVLNENRAKKNFFTKQLILSKGFHQIEIEYSPPQEGMPLLSLFINPNDSSYPSPQFFRN